MNTIIACFLLFFAGKMSAEKPADSVKQASQKDPGLFTLIVLPDTQGYADVRHKETQKHWPSIGDQRFCFFKQTEWIKENKKKRNIVMTVHVGDITQTQHDEEWDIADTAFKTIDNHVPYILAREIMIWVTRQNKGRLAILEEVVLVLISLRNVL